MGRLTGTTTSYAFLSGQNFSNTYSYDASSNLTGLTAADGSSNIYQYDTLNRLTSLNNSWAGQFGFSYDSLSRRTQMTRPNGVNTTYQYDSVSHLLSVLHGGGTDGENYTYDSAGNRTSKQNLLTGATENYSYDPLYELTRVISGANTTGNYSYDPVGNRLSSLLGQYTFNSSNEVTAAVTNSYTYDNNGNLLSMTTGAGISNYTWDFENRLISATVPGQNGGGATTVTFQYDPMGRRIQKSSTNGSNIIYLYSGSNIVAEVNSSGAVTSSFLPGLGIDEPLAIDQAGIPYYYEQDGLGSVTSLTGAAGQSAASYTYDVFGKATETGGIRQPFRFTGREWDYETGLYYYRARYYDPSIGRFISEDPTRFAGSGTNFYAYAGNRPTSLKDPFGLCPTCSDVFKNSLVGTLAQVAEALHVADMKDYADNAVAALQGATSSLYAISQSVLSVPKNGWATPGIWASSLGAASVLIKFGGQINTAAAAIEESANPAIVTVGLSALDYALVKAVLAEGSAALNGNCTAN